MPDVELSDLRAELAELRDAVNTTRVVCKALQTQARMAVRLAFSLDEQLGRFDSQVQALQRQATEAKRDDQQHNEENRPESRQGISQLARVV